MAEEVLLVPGHVKVRMVVSRLLAQLSRATLHDADDDDGGEATEAVRTSIRVGHTTRAAADGPMDQRFLVLEARLLTFGRLRKLSWLAVAQGSRHRAGVDRHGRWHTVGSCGALRSSIVEQAHRPNLIKTS